MPKDRFNRPRTNGYGTESLYRTPGRPVYNPRMRKAFAAQAKRVEENKLPYETVREVARMWYLGDSSMTTALVAAQLSLGVGSVERMTTGRSYKHKWLRAVSEIILEGHECVQPRVRKRAERSSGLC